MPEGPSIVILKEAVSRFRKKKVVAAGGYAKVDTDLISGSIIRDIKTWGKHLLICFDKRFVRIHLLMFGSYTINERKDVNPKLALKFKAGELNFYTCAVKITEGSPNDVYDWSGDIMNKAWDPKKAKAKLKEKPNALICDILPDQDIFAGVGNIIRNEVLFNIKLHPKSKVGKIPARKISQLMKEVVKYSFNFLEWKKDGTLKKHWLAHTKKTCPRCKIPLHKDYPGKTKRRSYFCNNCQELFK